MHVTQDVIPHGFRGDLVLLKTVDTLVHQTGVRIFIETGSFHGVTTRHMAQSYPHIACYSCEPDLFRYKQALLATAGLPNCLVTNEESPQLLERLTSKNIVQQPTLFWLDAHGYGFDWPLRKEVELIATYWHTAYVLIDDFRVPGCEQFGYDTYGAQACSYEYIADVLNVRSDTRIWYPNYDPRNATWPARGWCLITFNASVQLHDLTEGSLAQEAM